MYTLTKPTQYNYNNSNSIQRILYILYNNQVSKYQIFIQDESIRTYTYYILSFIHNDRNDENKLE